MLTAAVEQIFLLIELRDRQRGGSRHHAPNCTSEKSPNCTSEKSKVSPDIEEQLLLD